MFTEQAECGQLAGLFAELGANLDDYLRFAHSDALKGSCEWQRALGHELPRQGKGMAEVMKLLSNQLLPNGSAIAKPGFTSFITTGASTAGVISQAAASLAGTQRLGLNAFSHLEALSLEWLKQLFALPSSMQGLYTSGGSMANLIALGAARQFAYEQIGIDVAETGNLLPGRIYVSDLTHKSIHRCAAALGLGRQSIVAVASDSMGRLCPEALARQIDEDLHAGCLPIAIVANAGATSTGVVDPIAEILEVSRKHNIWLHVDGAYGLPGILDAQVRHLFEGLEQADSVTVDPHKWLGAPVGIGTVFVRDRAMLKRAFSQEHSDYLEGALDEADIQHSMDSLGIPFNDYGVELSAPSRGAVVWALLSEIGLEGMRNRICRHNAMASWLAEQAKAHPNLELLQEPTLSICCFRYVAQGHPDLNALNRQIHRQLVRNNRNLPSTAMLNGKLALRPCFVGARTGWEQAQALVDEVLQLGARLAAEY